MVNFRKQVEKTKFPTQELTDLFEAAEPIVAMVEAYINGKDIKSVVAKPAAAPAPVEDTKLIPDLITPDQVRALVAAGEVSLEVYKAIAEQWSVKVKGNSKEAYHEAIFKNIALFEATRTWPNPLPLPLPHPRKRNRKSLKTGSSRDG